MKAKKASPNPAGDAVVDNSGKLKVFISWSGPRSKHIATALHGWLPLVIQASDPWMSSEDIRKGGRGLSDIAKALEQTSVGIVCLTPENQSEPWLLFESGALSKLGSARLCTYLLDLEPGDVQNPLGLFQHTRAAKGETFEMMRSINDAACEGALEASRLAQLYEMCWPSLDEKLKHIPAASAPSPPNRDDREKIDEILSIVRDFGRDRAGACPPRTADDVVFSALADRAAKDVRLRLALQTLAAYGATPLTLERILYRLRMDRRDDEMNASTQEEDDSPW